MLHIKANKLWKSELRARDVQLILRVSRIMPNWHHAQMAGSDAVELVNVAKYILGSGGFSAKELLMLEDHFYVGDGPQSIELKPVGTKSTKIKVSSGGKIDADADDEKNSTNEIKMSLS